MQQSLTLFERLSRARQGGAKTQRLDPDELRRSILGNLQDILNTNLGSSAAQPDLGVPAPHEIMATYPMSADRMLQAIAHSIERYEPRLARIRVVHIPRDDGSELELRFRISGEIPALNGQRIGLDTRIQHNGRVSCRGQLK